MNDADKRAFMAWYLDFGFAVDSTMQEAVWQAACKWRDSQVVSKAEIDPCPSCKPNTVCRTPSCGRLKGKRQEPITPPAAQINQQLVQALEKIVECDADGLPVRTFQQREEIARAALAAAKSGDV